MPKQVDHDDRRRALAEALWRIVMRDGIEAASVRRVAAEAGWSTGSLRHYFDSQSELLAFAMELVAQRVRERIAALAPEPDPRAQAAQLLEQTLPLDDERRAEMQVWLAFTMRSVVDPALRGMRDAAHAGLRALCRDVAAALDPDGDADVQGERLHAVLDGVALHAVLAPDHTTPARQRAILRAHLGGLGRDL